MRDWNTLEDRILVAARDHLGQTATYTPASTGTPQTVRVIYDRRSILLNAIGEVGVREQMVEIQARSADLSPSPIVGDAFVVGGQTWRVVDAPQADGQGGIVIKLGTESV